MNEILKKLPLDKTKLDERYNSILAPFAAKNPKDDSRERYEEIRENENRSDFQRDRDRIIHSKAFRRLMYKTQVFVNHEGDHFRTRLTHTLEVSQFARGVCKSLALNEELAEAIALGHDLGHTPFGHAVERYLDVKLKKEDMGQFYHNEQSVRIVDFIEKRCDNYNGLNLTYEVREGILKHNGLSDRSGIYKNLNPDRVCSTLEGQVVKQVDTIAYICHDLQDGIESGLIEKTMEENTSYKKVMMELKEYIAKFLNRPIESIDFTKHGRTYFINDLIHKLMMKITENSVKNLITYSIESREDVILKANNNIELICFDKTTNEIFKKIKVIIYNYVYGINTIQAMDEKAVKVISDLFDKYNNNPKLLPPDWYFKYCNFENDTLYDGAINSSIRVISDYITTMTDRYALDEHERLYNPRIKI